MSLGHIASWQEPVKTKQLFCKCAGGETDAKELMSRLYAPHELKAYKPKKVNFSHTCTPVYSKAASLGYVEYGTDVTLDIADLTDCYSISLPIHGTQELTQCGEIACSDRHQAVIMSPSLPASLHISGDCKKSMVRISREALERQLATLLQCPISEPIIFDIHMDAVKGKSASWWRTVLHLQEELGSTDSMYVGDAFLQQVEQMIITGLLSSQKHNYSSELNTHCKEVAPASVQRAEFFMRDNMQRMITMNEIIESAQTSQNTLYSAFKRFHGISPVAFFRNLRMDAAHHDLLEAGKNENITSTSLKWGFNHLGRFSIEYKKRFGELPSETRKSRSERVGVKI